MTTEQYPKVYLYRRIVQAKLFIDNNYTDDIDLDIISDEAYFSKFHFIRLFKQIYGKTPHQYLTSCRLEKAKQLLIKGLTVSEVCASVGFESLSSFSSLFKNAVGETPTAFLSNQVARKTEMTTSPLKFIPGCIAAKNGWLKISNFQEAE
ncbi:MAG: AraC family transcriptional regulator [Chitinophagaceae bacterium]